MTDDDLVPRLSAIQARVNQPTPDFRAEAEAHVRGTNGWMSSSYDLSCDPDVLDFADQLQSYWDEKEELRADCRFLLEQIAKLQQENVELKTTIMQARSGESRDLPPSVSTRPPE